MARIQRVFLIGPMGAGKTTIGRVLAQNLQLEFVDSDQEIEERTGADIPWIFDVEGEAGFRERELKVIAELTLRDGVLLATGGGVVIKPENRSALAGRGIVVYLHATLAQQVARTGRDKQRPLLQTEDPEQTLRDLMAVRDPLYREIADYIVDTDGLGARTVAQKITHLLTETD
jgi:shikimate kinase